MIGTPNQIEWAEQIRPRVDAEFDRVAKALTHAVRDSAVTRALIALLEEKRSEVMANDRAGYFIRDWQELSDQVRQMISKDPRFQVIRAARQK
jgi:uncharacterized protein (UPF0216 family)